MSLITTTIEQPTEELWLFRLLDWARSVDWSTWYVCLYGLLVPVVAINAPGIGGVGVADLLMPLSFGALIFSARKNVVQPAHIALCLFVLAALISLTQITDKSALVSCTIRWVRLLGILTPFFVALNMRVTDQLINRAIVSWAIGGLIAILIGIFLHTFQIEVREGQQRLWVAGGSYIRAGGLIGNSGAFGHMSATWAVVTIVSVLHIWKSKYSHWVAGGLAMLCGYVVYASSSRAAMMHMGVAAIVTMLVIPISKNSRRKLAALVIGGLLCVTTLFLVSQVLPIDGMADKSKALQTNLERFVPGLGGSSSNFTSNRSENWPEYIEMMSDSILFGAGYKMGVRMHEESPDNSYLSVMLETGAVGFACMALFVCCVLIRLTILYFAKNKYAVVLIPVCLGQLANCMTSDIYTFWITMPVVFLLLGLVVNCVQNSDQLSFDQHQCLT